MFGHWKSAIFEFGQSVSNDTKTALNVTDANPKVLSKVYKKVQMHNVLKERNVGLINYVD